MNNKSALIVFLGNINYDSRASNFYKSLTEKGCEVKVVSFDWLTKDFKTQRGYISIYKLNKKFLSLTYYLKFSLLLSYKLLISSADIIFAEDVYTLPFAAAIAKVKNVFRLNRMEIKVYYDSRELYGYLAGLRKRKFVQLSLKNIEKLCIKHVDKIIATGEMDAQFLENEYRVKNIIVIRNLPLSNAISHPVDLHEKFKIEKGKKILLYQGVIFHGRGLKLIFDLMAKLDDCVFIIIGDGDQKKYYENLAIEKGIAERIIFAGKINQSELMNYTAGADIGLALIENISLSYYYALPNKMFEYILSGVPVLVSSFPQMKKIVDEYKVGISVDPENKVESLAALKKILSDESLNIELKNNCKKAALELNWEKEIQKLFPLE